MPSRRAISCVDTDDAFSRIISRAWRIVIRSAGTDRSLGLPKGRPDQANGGAHQSTKDPGRDHSVMGGAIISESGGGIIPLRGAASSRNWGAASSGISRVIGSESVKGRFLPLAGVLGPRCGRGRSGRNLRQHDRPIRGFRAGASMARGEAIDRHQGGLCRSCWKVHLPTEFRRPPGRTHHVGVVDQHRLNSTHGCRSRGPH